jgi:hypothetical protein
MTLRGIDYDGRCLQCCLRIPLAFGSVESKDLYAMFSETFRRVSITLDECIFEHGQGTALAAVCCDDTAD